jgi:hypothetical protein
VSLKLSPRLEDNHLQEKRDLAHPRQKPIEIILRPDVKKPDCFTRSFLAKLHID